MTHFLLFIVLGCTQKSETENSGVDTDTSDTNDVDTGDQNDTQDHEEDTDPEETGTDTSEDTAELDTAQPQEECQLEVQIEEQTIISGNQVSFTSVPARTNTVMLTLSMYNPCLHTDLRFLGFPDDWVQGDGFEISTLPPILIPPQETASMVLEFRPGDQGTYTGSFHLPYDQPDAPFILELTAVVTAPLRIVLVGDGYIATTSDYGESFTEQIYTTEVHSNDLRRGACWGFGQFIATGGSDQSMIWTSPDGENWTSFNRGGGWLADCAVGNEMIVVAGGAHRLVSSSDGQSWIDGGDYGDHFRTIAYGDGVFVAAGDSGIGLSTDGNTWTSLQDHGVNGIGDIRFGNGLFVGVGENGTVISSSDAGQTWATAAVGSFNWQTVLYADEMFYIGDGSNLYQSADGLSWNLVNITNGIIPRAIIGTTLFGSSGTGFYRSEDLGFSWTEVYIWSSVGGFNDVAVEGY